MTERQVNTGVSKKHEQAFELFRESNGLASNAVIARKLDVPTATVRKWKSRYKWLEQMGIEQSVTPRKKDDVTDKKADIREEQRERLIDVLAEVYTPALDFLIDIYLDAYEEYQQLKQDGMAEEKNRKEVARLLSQLGLDGKNQALIKKGKTPLAEDGKKQDEQSFVSRLDDFRARRKRG